MRNILSKFCVVYTRATTDPWRDDSNNHESDDTWYGFIHDWHVEKTVGRVFSQVSENLGQRKRTTILRIREINDEFKL